MRLTQVVRNDLGKFWRLVADKRPPEDRNPTPAGRERIRKWSDLPKLRTVDEAVEDMRLADAFLRAGKPGKAANELKKQANELKKQMDELTKEANKLAKQAKAEPNRVRWTMLLEQGTSHQAEVLRLCGLRNQMLDQTKPLQREVFQILGQEWITNYLRAKAVVLWRA